MSQNPDQLTTKDSFDRLYEIIRRLRAPDGCPWDREQTPQTMRGALIEEAYECIEAINDGDPQHLKEELGDVFLVLIMIGYMHEQTGQFTISQALDEVSDKLIRRHPHVFGDTIAQDSQAVLAQWQTIKVEVEGRKPKDSLMDEISKALHPLERAFAMQKKAAKVGFDWLKVEDVWDKVFEELQEAREAHRLGHMKDLESEIGDLLFSVINLARYTKIDPNQALSRTISKFDRRFRSVESGMKDQGLPLEKQHFTIMDDLWNASKKHHP